MATYTRAVRASAWPTIDRIRQTLSLLDDASDDLERLGLDCYSLVDQEDPLEPLAGAPMPTAEDLAVLTTLVEQYGDDLKTMEGFLDDFRKLRNSVVYLMMRSPWPGGDAA